MEGEVAVLAEKTQEESKKKEEQEHTHTRTVIAAECLDIFANAPVQSLDMCVLVAFPKRGQ